MLYPSEIYNWNDNSRVLSRGHRTRRCIDCILCNRGFIYGQDEVRCIIILESQSITPALRSSVIEIVLEFPRFIVESIFNPFKKKIYSLKVASPSIYYPNFSFNLRNEWVLLLLLLFFFDRYLNLFQSSLPNRNRVISILLFARISFINWSTVALYNFIIYLLFF